MNLPSVTTETTITVKMQEDCASEFVQFVGDYVVSAVGVNYANLRKDYPAMMKLWDALNLR